jgi:hypothetical protein
MVVSTSGRKVYYKKPRAKMARVGGQTVVKRENQSGHKIYLNRKYKK